MDRDKLLKAVESRLPFRVAQKLLRDAGFPKGNSWDAILEKLADKDGDRGADVAKLNESYVQSLIVSEKSLALFEVSEDDMVKAHRAVTALSKSLPQSDALAAFPFFVDAAKLRQLPANDLAPVAVLDLDEGTVVLFSGVRILEERETVLPSQLAATAKGRYDSVVGIRKEYRQTYNCVVLPHKGTVIECYVDAPLGDPEKLIELDHMSLVSTFNKAVGFQVLNQDINLFPLISKLYDSEEGMVSHLSHAVSTSVKHEKMREAGKCVRTELFHAAGFKAVGGAIQPFAITVVWGLEDETYLESNPALSVEGTYALTYQRHPSVHTAKIRKCASYADAAFVLSKILPMLAP